ncbi:hypothetical protein BXZ70DRAFT_950585 [Cristinia sonorae]|uniref:Uncharacterized protein n=1 Tax=Cristinia sonorae TaxID=1940300 RepID=A0A8K0XM55_9AGAR|nr:hypothetical protein BXZ70DRAFT_950585 [Cristinia sonorae]
MGSDSEYSSGEYGHRGIDGHGKKDKKDKKDKDKKHKEGKDGKDKKDKKDKEKKDKDKDKKKDDKHKEGKHDAHGAYPAPAHGVPGFPGAPVPGGHGFPPGPPGYAPPPTHGHAAEFFGTAAPPGAPSPYGATPHGPPAPYGGAPYGAPLAPHGAPTPYGAPAPYGAPPAPYGGFPGAQSFAFGDPHISRDVHSPPVGGPPHPPTPGHSGPPPPSGFRVPLSTDQPFTVPQHQTGPPVSYEPDGRTPVFIGSAITNNAVHPCKIVPTLSPPCRVPYGGGEHGHQGRYDLLPFDPATMEWVTTSKGKVPPGKRPIEGGYEDHTGKLYHALAKIQGVKVPGKTGEHLGGANIPFGGGEHFVEKDYEILCWR